MSEQAPNSALWPPQPAVAALPRGPVVDTAAYVARGSCPRDGCGGTLWYDNDTTEQVCGACATLFGAHADTTPLGASDDGDDGAATQRHDTYSNGRRRCYGGYRRAYEATGDDHEQYAINQETPDGSALWTPHADRATIQ